MKKNVQRSLLVSAACAMALLFAQSSLAQGMNPALVTIRFNQERVYYEQPLYQAISQAVAVKPQVMFDVVSKAPSTGDSSNDAKWQEVASRNTQAVVASLTQMGVPMSRIHVSGQAQAGLRYDEVQVFVR